MGIIDRLFNVEQRVKKLAATFCCGETFLTLAGDPSTTDIPAGHSRIVKNLGSGAIALWVNDGGSLKKTLLT